MCFARRYFVMASATPAARCTLSGAAMATGWLLAPGDTPLEVAFDAAVQRLSELASLGEANSTPQQLELRLQLLKVLNDFPVVCKTLRDRAGRWPVLPGALVLRAARVSESPLLAIFWRAVPPDFPSSAATAKSKCPTMTSPRSG